MKMLRTLFLLVMFTFASSVCANTFGISTTVENRTNELILIKVCAYSSETFSKIDDCAEEHLKKLFISAGESETVSFVTHWGGFKFFWEVDSPVQGIKNPKGSVIYDGKSVISIQNK